MPSTTNANTLLLMSVFLAAALGGITWAGTVYVDDDGPADFNNIQAAIDNSNHGDIIVVNPGTYTGIGNRDIDLNGIAITVRSIDPNDPNIVAATIIDCNGTEEEPHRGFYFHNGEDSNSVLSGLTITNGYAPDELIRAALLSSGGAIMCTGSSPVVSNCILRNNKAGYGGGAIFCLNYSRPTITNCLIVGNQGSRGGGITCWQHSTATINKCTISNCQGNGIWFSDTSGLQITISNCVITGNRDTTFGGGIYIRSTLGSIIINCIISNNEAGYKGGGIYCNAGSPEFINCTFSGNKALRDEGGAIFCTSSATPTITNCILWNDLPDEIYAPPDAALPLVSFSNIQGGWFGVGNKDVDPLFVRPGFWDPNGTPADNNDDFWVDGDYHLCECSELVDGGTNNPPGDISITDIDGNPRPADGDGDGIAVTDIGAYEDPSFCEEAFIKVAPRELEVEVSSVDGNDLQYRTLQIWICGEGMLNWEITGGCDWLEVIPANGSLSGEVDDVTLIIDPNSLCTGKYKCNLTVLATNASNTSVIVEVILHIGATLRVPQNYSTIQEAIDDSDNGDTVVVSPGIYTGEGNKYIDFHGKAITVCSENGPSDCIIESDYEKPGFYFHSSEGPNSIVSGFTVRKARSGFYIQSSSPRISNCIITGNKGRHGGSGNFRGGGVYVSPWGHGPTKPIIENCIITNNVATGGEGMNGQFSRGNAYGAGIYAASDQVSLTLKNCVVSNNKCFAGNRRLAGPPFYGVSSAYGAGVYLNQTGGSIISNCTITNNELYPGHDISGDRIGDALGAGINCQYDSELTIENSIIWDNKAYYYNYSNYKNSQIYGSPLVTYSNVKGGFEDIGNIDRDPCFADADNGDYHLLSDSPCINAGDPNYPYSPNDTDLDGKPRVIGGRIDMGAYEFNHIPVADVGADQVVECACNTEEGTKVTLDGSGSYDADDDPLTFTWTGPFVGSPADGATPTVTLEAGCPDDYVITLVVNDGTEVSGPDEVLITVVDTTPPHFELSVSPTMLWPPDHKMYEITPSCTVSDECDATPDVMLVSIAMSEANDIPGGGNTSDDIQIGEDGSIFLRSERSGTSSERIYTITYQAVDDSGNAAVGSATVSIPHDFKVLARIAARWLWANPSGRIPEDLNGDGIVNLADFARFAENWIK